MATERLNDAWLVGTTWWQGCGELLPQDNCFCKAMAVSQAFIFHFKCYSILHFAVCQLLCWAFLFLYIDPLGAVCVQRNFLVLICNFCKFPSVVLYNLKYILLFPLQKLLYLAFIVVVVIMVTVSTDMWLNINSGSLIYTLHIEDAYFKKVGDFCYL